MSTYRVTVMVTTDVDGEYDTDAMTNAIQKIRAIVGEEQECWVTGIASDCDGGYLTFKQTPIPN